MILMSLDDLLFTGLITSIITIGAWGSIQIIDWWINVLRFYDLGEGDF